MVRSISQAVSYGVPALVVGYIAQYQQFYTWRQNEDHWAIPSVILGTVPPVAGIRHHGHRVPDVRVYKGVGIVELNVDTDTRCLSGDGGIRQFYIDHEPVAISRCGDQHVVIQVSGEAVKFVSGHFIGPVVFHSATTTLEDPCEKGDLRHLLASWCKTSSR